MELKDQKLQALERENRFLEVKIIIKEVLELSLSLIMINKKQYFRLRLALAELRETKLEMRKIKIESSKDKFEQTNRQTNGWRLAFL